jgi:excisionase family DNA binding protein
VKTVELIGSSEAARRCGVSDETIRNWAARGKLSSIKTGIGTVYPLHEVERLAVERAELLRARLQALTAAAGV